MAYRNKEYCSSISPSSTTATVPLNAHSAKPMEAICRLIMNGQICVFLFQL